MPSPELTGTESTPQELLRAWVRGHSQDAFRELSTRYFDLVYSVAVRRLGVHRDAAADIAQAVFSLLARKAEGLPDGIVIGAWLHRQTLRQCSNFLRAESRRRNRETQAATTLYAGESGDLAWNELAPELDEAIAGLDRQAREILILRYYQHQTTSEIAAVLEISRDAAQKRLERALAGLRTKLRKRLSAPAVAGLAGMLSARAVQAAPAGIALRVAGQAAADFQNAGVLARLGGRIFGNPLTALAGLAAGCVLGWGAAGPAVTDVTAPGSAVIPHSPAEPRKAGPLSARADAGESILAALERVSRQPRTLRRTVEMDAILLRPEAADLAALCARAAGTLSSGSRGIVMGTLVTRWAADDPAGAMEFLGQFSRESWSQGLFSKVCGEWLNHDAKAAADWLALHAVPVEKFGHGLDSFASLAGQTAASLTKMDPEAGLAFVLRLPAAMRKQMTGRLADDDYSQRWRTHWGSSRWRTLADGVAAAVAAGDLTPDVLARVVASWKGNDPSGAEAWSAPAAGRELAEFMARIVRPIPGLGEFVKPEPAEAFQQRMTSALSLRGDLPLTDALTAVASEWPAPLDSLDGWLRAQEAGREADAARVILVRRMAGNWQPVRPGARKIPEQAAAFAAAEEIQDSTVREALIRGLFRRWHSADPAGAAAWLSAAEWPTERVAILHQRLDLP